MKTLAFAALLSISAANADAPTEPPALQDGFDFMCRGDLCTVRRAAFQDLVRSQGNTPCWKRT